MASSRVRITHRPPLRAPLSALLLLLLVATATHVQSETAKATAALKHFYEVMGGDEWTNSRNWNVGDPCEQGWYGVRCNYATIDGRTLKLELQSNNIRGKLEDTDLRDLQWLRDIYLNDNNITGTYPMYLCNMITLQGLVLANNQMHGTIPSEVRFNYNLVAFDLNDNDFEGTIPSGFAPMRQIDLILLRNNRLNGTVPADLLTGHLRQIDISGNEFTGEVPPMTGNRLELFYAAHNQLSGTIGDFGPRINRIDVSHNQLHGYLKESIARTQRLIRFNVEYNELSGTIPPELGHQRALLYLGHNYFSGSIPQNLSVVSRLYTEYNKLYGDLPPFLQSYPMNMIGALDLRGNAYWCPLPHWCSKPLGGNGMCDPCVTPKFCCHPHEGQGCSDIEISECVCGKVPSCCNDRWGPEWYIHVHSSSAFIFLVSFFLPFAFSSAHSF
eukprot:TRINITY_DN4135_c0_g1_i1.p1 TRINITY_DN4135_c0_g1~~TRINITY_DN4135_c0_g1_i1.p1  ORF type:complete len:442 (-),score=40.50 TRINITY_DN4135_c0_g1_i1:832-2157(-)